MVELTAETVAQQSLAEEVEAINAYSARLGTISSTSLSGIVRYNLSEERIHAKSLRDWLQTIDKDYAWSIFGGSKKAQLDTILGVFSPAILSNVNDVTIAQDSLREEIRAAEAYGFRISQLTKNYLSIKIDLQTIFFNNQNDELEHAYSLLKWLSNNNERWRVIVAEHFKSLSLVSKLEVCQLGVIKHELNSFMPSFQEEWAPWWGPKPVSRSGSKTSRTSRGGPSGGREKTSYIKGLQATNLSVNMEPLQRWFSNTDTIQTMWRKVKTKKQVWDPNAYDPTFHRKGAIVTIDEEMMIPPPQFVRKWGRRVVLERPSGTYRIDAGATGKKGYSGNYLVTLWVSPRMTTAGQTYNLREQEYAMLYKKDMTIEECERKTDELIHVIQGLW